MKETIIKILKYINTLLAPITQIVEKQRKYIGLFGIFLAFLSLGFLFFSNTVRDSGGYAMNILWAILWIPIFARVFGIKIVQVMMPLRKEMGILMGILAFVHGARYYLNYPTAISQDYFWKQDGFISYLAFGFFALLITIPLLFTSSRWAMKKMGKYWKWLHRGVYIIIILSVAHVVLLKGFLHLEYGPLFFLFLYFFFKYLEWKGFQFLSPYGLTYPQGQKWICLPCGYIYDPIIGDEDGGIAPGTEFTDISDNWKCPDCGVSKSDFVPFDETHPPISFAAKIIEKKFLNPTTIELTIETEEEIPSLPGQYMSFYWNDSDGEFRRSYSITNRSRKKFTFLIKLMNMGRGARILRDISSNADIRIAGVFGSFRLQDTQNPKIFIATGTGLSPIYAMITSLSPQIKKKIYFSVASHEDLFYVDEIESIQDLESSIHLTREKSEIHREGRIDIDSIVATPETEWYLCGNPGMITEAREKLQKRGFTHVYSEEF